MAKKLIALRVPVEIAEAVQAIADRDERTMSYVACRLLAEALGLVDPLVSVWKPSTKTFDLPRRQAPARGRSNRVPAVGP